MVDRVYRTGLPHLEESLANLREEFSRLRTATDWVGLRIDPLLAHLGQLRPRIRAWDSSNLRGAVPMLHSDLVYLRTNVEELDKLLRSEQRRARTRKGTR